MKASAIWRSMILLFVLLLPGGVLATQQAEARTTLPTINAQDTAMDVPACPAAPDRLLIKFREGVQPKSDDHGRMQTGSNTLNGLLASAAIQDAQPLFLQLPSQSAPLALQGMYRVDLMPGSDVAAMVTAFSADPAIEWAEPDYLAQPATTTPNDPLLSQQWGLAKIAAPAAWDVFTGTQTTVIAVIDSGIDLTHPDLVNQLWTNPGEIPGNGLDDDNNGHIDDVHGWNFNGKSGNVADGNGHGTEVAGVLAAATNNGLGMAGMCWGCKIMIVRVMSESGVSNYSDIALAVRYAADKGANVINLSLGGYAFSNALSETIDYAVAKGVVVVGGAGNDNISTPFYPAAYANVIAVTGTDGNDVKASFSNYGAWVDVSAPGEGITTTFLGGDYGSASGTSLAAPFVSGLAALIRSQHPDWSAVLVRNQILHSVDPVDALNPSFTGQLGVGRINALLATQTPQPILSLVQTTINGDPLGLPSPGAKATLALAIRNDWLDAQNVTGLLQTTDSNVTIGHSVATYGNLPSGSTGTSSSSYEFTVAAGAGFSHPIQFTLKLTANGGNYSITIPLTITTRSAEENFCGTISANQTWTKDKTYIINCNVGIAPDRTLTIQAGTVVKFNGNYSLNVGGTLIADGTATQPIQFTGNAGNSWNRILFDDPSTDAQTTNDGVYQSGNILRHVRIDSAANGIACSNATPYLEQVTLSGGGMICAAGATPLWLRESDLNGAIRMGVIAEAQLAQESSLHMAAITALNVDPTATPTSAASPTPTPTSTSTPIGGQSPGYRLQGSTFRSNLTLPSAAQVLTSTVFGTIRVGDNGIVQNTTSRGIALNSGFVGNNMVRGGGITVGSNSIIRNNSVEDAPDWGIRATGNTTVEYNRILGGSNGIQVEGSLVQGNLIANIAGFGLDIGSATVVSNTLTGIGGSAIRIRTGTPVEISGNNFEFNAGQFTIENRTPSEISAQGNWWGTTSNSILDQRIWDFNDDYTLGTVAYGPVLSKPSTDAPAYVRSVTLSPGSPVGIQPVTFNVQFSRQMNSEVAPELSFISPMGWTTRSTTTIPRSSGAVVGANNGRIYAIGGVDVVEEFDPATDIVTVRSPMPTGRWYLAGAAAPNGRIYAIGGSSSTIRAFATVEEYDPVMDKWSTRSPMPTARAGLGVAAAPNGRLYAIGGWSASGSGEVLATVEEYDPTTDKWTTRSPMPTARGLLAVAAAPNGRLYAIGGLSTNNWLATVEEYDPATDKWTTRSPMPTVRSWFAAATALNGRIYVIGGHQDQPWPHTLATVEEYDPIRNTWTTRPSMPTSREALGVAAALNGKLYAIGGLYDQNPGTTFYTTIEEFTPPMTYSDFHENKWPTADSYQSNYEFSTLVPRGVYTVTVSGANGSDGIQIAPAASTMFTVAYAGAINDTSAPPAPSLGVDLCRASITSAAARWTAHDPDSAITLYQYAIGLSSGSEEVINWTYTPELGFDRAGLNLTMGQSYYVSVKARNEGGLWSEASYGTFTAGVPCKQVFLPLLQR